MCCEGAGLREAQGGQLTQRREGAKEAKRFSGRGGMDKAGLAVLGSEFNTVASKSGQTSPIHGTLGWDVDSYKTRKFSDPLDSIQVLA